VLDAELVEQVFGIRSHVIADPVSGSPLIVPIGRHHVH
jgi:iron complex transport system ATP-binding protein